MKIISVWFWWLLFAHSTTRNHSKCVRKTNKTPTNKSTPKWLQKQQQKRKLEQPMKTCDSTTWLIWYAFHFTPYMILVFLKTRTYFIITVKVFHSVKQEAILKGLLEIKFSMNWSTGKHFVCLLCASNLLLPDMFGGLQTAPFSILSISGTLINNRKSLYVKFMIYYYLS